MSRGTIFRSAAVSYKAEPIYYSLQEVNKVENPVERIGAMAEMVQYVIVRGDLKKLAWPLGAIIAQACHACSAIIHIYHDDPNVIKYVSDLDKMHKVILETEDESSLRQLSQKLNEAQVDHKLWIEQPENCATCLAVKPHKKQDVQQYFKGLKLLK